MKKIFFILLAIVPFYISGQNILDVYNASTSFYQGTAKSMAMGNAMSAVGSDFSSMSINPAGLGLYRSNSFVITPSIYNTYTKDNYNGTLSGDTKSKLSFNNFGIVCVEPEQNKVYRTTWAIGMNRVNNYNNDIYINGHNADNSLIDAYFEEIIANGIQNSRMLEEYSPTYIYPLYQLYLIDFTPDGLVTPVPLGDIKQSKGVNSWGGTNEWTFSTSLSISDKLFFGISLNFPYMYSKRISDYKEEFVIDSRSYYWLQEEILNTSGWGLNSKIGILAYPTRWLRIGAAFHTPTIYNLTDAWKTETIADLGGHGEDFILTPTSYFNYSLRTPYRANAGAAFIIGNYGMITADYEFVDYRTIRLYSPIYNYVDYNNNIYNTFSYTMNIRLGAEWRYQNLCFRGGYALYGSPYGISDDNLRRDAFSCGIGYTKHFFTFDLAYVYSIQDNDYNLYSQYTAYYDMVAPNLVQERTNFHNIVMTFKFKVR